MNNLRQAAQQALEASDALKRGRGPFDEKGVATVPFFYLRELGAAMEQLRQALAEPEQEPVGTARELFTNAALEQLDIRPSTTVYLGAPTPRKPVELTDEEITDAVNGMGPDVGSYEHRLARAVIAAYEAKQGEQV